MEVDPPSGSTSGGGGNSNNGGPGLKRANSAPMINELPGTTATTATTIPMSRESPTAQLFAGVLQPRVRRFSASFSPVRSGGTSPVPCGIPTRVSQLKLEEGMDLANREAAQECEMVSAIKFSQSWEDLSLTVESGRRPSRNYTDPLHLNMPSAPCPSAGSSPLASPSPTRGNPTVGIVPSTLPRQCFSPGVQVAVRGLPFSPSPSPSPTRKSFTRRSLSPITMRPSPLGAVKRKSEMDPDCSFAPAPKRLSLMGHGCSPNLTERIGLLMAHPLASRFASSLDNTPSPNPGSLSSVGTPDSMSSSDSPNNCLFQPVHSPATSQMSSESDAMMVDACLSKASSDIHRMSVDDSMSDDLDHMLSAKKDEDSSGQSSK